MDTAKDVSKPASSDTSVQLNNPTVSTALGTPFPVTLIRVDRKPQPMTYQFADKTDMLSMCKSGAKSNVKVVYTCTPLNSQQVKIKKEAAAIPICTTGIASIQSGTQISKNLQPVIVKTETSAADILPIHPDQSLVKVEPLDDVVVIENKEICRGVKKTEPAWNNDITQQKNSTTSTTQATSSVATLQCTSPQAGTLSPPVLKSISPLSSVQGHDTPPLLTVESDLTPLDPMKTPANSATASAILKQKIASFVASNRSYMDVNNQLPTKLTIQGKTIVPVGLSSYKAPQNTTVYQQQDVDEKSKDNICTISTPSEPPVRVSFKPKRQDRNKKRKKEGEEVPIYTCNRCMIAFSQDSQLKAHFLSAHAEDEGGNCPSFKCHFCNILFPGKGDLTAHLVKHHASKGVVSLHEPASPNPMQPESQPTPLEEPPQKITASQHQSIISQLQSHKSHSVAPTLQNRPVTAIGGLSEKRLKVEKDRLSPLKASNAESCNLCGCLFPYKRSLDIHRLKEHVNIFSPTSSVSLDRSETVNLEIEGQNGSSYVQQNVVHKTSFCLSCGYPCKSNSELGKHIYSKHGGKYFCPASGCDRIYHERRCLKLHINSHHPKFRAYSCKSCSYCTYQQLAILRHLDSHVKEIDTIDLSVDDQEAESDNVIEEESGPAGDDKNKSETEREKETVEMDAEETSAPYVYIERFNGEEVVDVPFNPPTEAPPSPPPAKVPKHVPKASTKRGKSSKSQSQSGFRCLDCKGYFLDRNTLSAHFSYCGSNVSVPAKKKKQEKSFLPDQMVRTCNLCFKNFKSNTALKSHRRYMHFNHSAEDNTLS